MRADGATPRVDLTFPSGASEEASNFTSWFFLAPDGNVRSTRGVAPSARTPGFPNACPSRYMRLEPSPAKTSAPESRIRAHERRKNS